MLDYQKRILEEKEELAKKLEKLDNYLVDPKKCIDGIGLPEFLRLYKQQTAMRLYLNILLERIDHFVIENEEIL